VEQYAGDLVNTFLRDRVPQESKKRGDEAMTDENRKDQEKKDELTEKDLDQASGGHNTSDGGHLDSGGHMPAGGHPRDGKR
jgi:hypothetical protein